MYYVGFGFLFGCIWILLVFGVCFWCLLKALLMLLAVSVDLFVASVLIGGWLFLDIRVIVLVAGCCVDLWHLIVLFEFAYSCGILFITV